VWKITFFSDLWSDKKRNRKIPSVKNINSNMSTKSNQILSNVQIFVLELYAYLLTVYNA